MMANSEIFVKLYPSNQFLGYATVENVICLRAGHDPRLKNFELRFKRKSNEAGCDKGAKAYKFHFNLIAFCVITTLLVINDFDELRL